MRIMNSLPIRFEGTAEQKFIFNPGRSDVYFHVRVCSQRGAYSDRNSRPAGRLSKLL